MILIGINGYKDSGKDSTAGYIQKWTEAHRLEFAVQAFADRMVLSMMRSLGLATNLNDARVIYDSFKKNGGILVEVPDLNISMEISGRQFAKWYGTEGHRDVFGDDFWIDLILPQPEWGLWDWRESFRPRGDVFAHVAVVSDVRFVNEAERVRALGGEIWNVDRGLGPDDHSSEQPLPKELIDVWIDNSSSFEALEVNVNTAMETRHNPTLDYNV